jgi:hypothetical protein
MVEAISVYRCLKHERQNTVETIDSHQVEPGARFLKRGLNLRTRVTSGVLLLNRDGFDVSEAAII